MSNPTGEAQRLILADLDILAHPPSAPITFCTALTLPAGNVKTNANAGTLGQGLALDVPLWANAADAYATYTEGTAGSGSYVSIYRCASPDASSPVLLTDDGTGGGVSQISALAPGSVFPLSVGGAKRIGFAMKDSDAAVPGGVTLKVTWYRR